MDSEFIDIGKKLLEGKKIGAVHLKGKEFNLDLTEEEYIERALKSNWPREEAEKYAKGYKAVQRDFICDFHSDFCLNSGGYGSGKSIALYIKLILFLKCFPGNRVLLGRKTLSDIDRAVLPELFELMPASWYEHRVKDGLININNGSQIVLFGLDAMQTGNIADIKKAQQKLKSLNLGAYFIDQLEEVEYEVFEVLNSRLRRADVPVRQGNMDCNPANFWAYHFFKLKKKKDGADWIPDEQNKASLYESSMLFNPNLPWDYIRKQLSMDSDYKERFVFGNWTTKILLKGTVFPDEYISRLERMRKPPVDKKEGCEIYEGPIAGEVYQMGVDPSDGVVDPSSISVVSGSGRKVAKFNGYVSIPELADKIKFLYYTYNKPLIIPEVNRSSILEHIKDLRLYRRIATDTYDREQGSKLGFSMNHRSKRELITHFLDLLRDNVPKIYDLNTTEEMRSFQYSDEATKQGAAAARGFHDDDVISTLLAFWNFNPKKAEDIKVARTKPVPMRRFQYI